MPPKLGILAGGGDLPARLVAACRDTGRDVFVVAFEDQADPALLDGVSHAWVRLGAAGTTLKLLRDAGVEEIVMAGGVRRPSLAALRPDLWATKFLARTGAALLGDDGLLSALVRELEEREGFRVVGIDDILPEALAPDGPLGAISPDDDARADIARGIEVARGIGTLDVGQGAVVQGGLVLAVEAVEGTDAMLSRAALLKRDGPGGVLVKVAKPGQERRADLPTIGPETVKAAAAAGLRGIAVQAGGALIVNRAQVVEAADAADLFVVGVAVDGDPAS